MRSKRLALGLLLLGVAAGAAALYYRHHTASDPPAHASVPVVAVSTVPVRVAPMADRVTSYGNLVPRRTVNIVPDTPGLLKEILFTDGQKVAAGAPLVVMDTSIAEAQVQASRAQAEADQQNLKRTQSLTRQGLDSTYSLEQAQSRAAASQSDLQINARKLARLTLRAPFAGTLGSHQVDAGAYLSSGETIVRLDDTELQVEFRVPSTVLLKSTAGMRVHVDVPGTTSDLAGDAQLTFVDPAVSTDTRSVLLRALVTDPDHHLRPGLFVRVSLELSVHENALVVPETAVTRELNTAYVYVVGADQTVHRRTVSTGLSDGEVVELLSGVEAGEQVVTIGQFRLRDGDKVKIVAPPAKPQGSA